MLGRKNPWVVRLEDIPGESGDAYNDLGSYAKRTALSLPQVFTDPIHAQFARAAKEVCRFEQSNPIDRAGYVVMGEYDALTATDIWVGYAAHRSQIEFGECP